MIPTDLPSASRQMLRLCCPSISTDQLFPRVVMERRFDDEDVTGTTRRFATGGPVGETRVQASSLTTGAHEALSARDLDLFAAFAGRHWGAHSAFKRT